MKKHFLLISLFALMFLWLGNYSFGQFANCHDGGVTCLDTETCTLIPADWSFGSVDRYECVIKTQTSTTTIPTTSTQTNADCLSTCLADPNLSVMNADLRQTKCNEKCTTTTSTVWTPCPTGTDPKWWIINTWGRCTCPDGYKDIDNTCLSCKTEWVCCGISLNTSVPFIGKCIEDTTGSVSPDETWVTWDQAFPVLMWSLTKILVTVILILSFVLIIIGGIMIATGDPSGGKKMIMRVVIGIALLGASGVILRLINPNFFG